MEFSKRWSRVESGRKQACNNDALPDPENVTSERPIFDLLVGSSEGARGGKDGTTSIVLHGTPRKDAMEERSEQCREMLVGDGEIQISGRREGAVALVLDLAKACERVSLPAGLGLGNALQFSWKDLASAMRVLRAPEAGSVRRICGAEPLLAITAILPRSKWRCLFQRIVLQDALSEVTQKLSASEHEGLVWMTSKHS